MKTARDKLDALDDTQVIAQVLDGETEVFEILMRRYNQLLFRLGMSYLRDENAVEDAMQNSYLKAYRGLTRFKGQAQFSTWLTRIMINECLQAMRKERSYEQIEVANDLPKHIITPETGEKILIQKEMKQILEKAVLSLPSKYRTVYLLRGVEGLSTRETATMLELSESNVKIRLSRARELLREEILKYSDGVEVFPFKGWRCDNLVERVMLQISP